MQLPGLRLPGDSESQTQWEVPRGSIPLLTDVGPVLTGASETCPRSGTSLVPSLLPQLPFRERCEFVLTVGSVHL